MGKVQRAAEAVGHRPLVGPCLDEQPRALGVWLLAGVVERLAHGVHRPAVIRVRARRQQQRRELCVARDARGAVQRALHPIAAHEPRVRVSPGIEQHVHDLSQRGRTRRVTPSQPREARVEDGCAPERAGRSRGALGRGADEPCDGLGVPRDARAGEVVAGQRRVDLKQCPGAADVARARRADEPLRSLSAGERARLDLELQPRPGRETVLTRDGKLGERELWELARATAGLGLVAQVA